VVSVAPNSLAANFAAAMYTKSINSNCRITLTNFEEHQWFPFFHELGHHLHFAQNGIYGGFASNVKREDKMRHADIEKQCDGFAALCYATFFDEKEAAAFFYRLPFTTEMTAQQTRYAKFSVIETPAIETPAIETVIETPVMPQIGATLISSHNGFTREAIVTKRTKTQIVCVSNGNTVRLRNNETGSKWQEVGSTGHPRDEWRLAETVVEAVETIETPAIETPAIETPTIETERLAALTAIRKMAREQALYPVYDIFQYRNGQKKLLHSFNGLLEWLEKYPEYFRSYSPRSGRILVSGMLYRIAIVETPTIETIEKPVVSVKAELAAHLTPFLPESKRDLATAIGIRPPSLSRVLNGEQMSFDTLEKLMSELGIAWSSEPFIHVWNAKNMLTLDVDAIFSHYHARKQDFTPVSAWQVWDVCIPTLDWRQADSAFETGGIEYRFVKHGRIRLLASLAPSCVFHLQVIE
jgi:transcriptional regulator with XRE-family HTH domain